MSKSDGDRARAKLERSNVQLAASSGSGKAYQSVAQSVSLAVDDAIDNLRNLAMGSATDAAVSKAQMQAAADANGATDDAPKTLPDA